MCDEIIAQSPMMLAIHPSMRPCVVNKPRATSSVVPVPLSEMTASEKITADAVTRNHDPVMMDAVRSGR